MHGHEGSARRLCAASTVPLGPDQWAAQMARDGMLEQHVWPRTPFVGTTESANLFRSGAGCRENAEIIQELKIKVGTLARRTELYKYTRASIRLALIGLRAC